MKRRGFLRLLLAAPAALALAPRLASAAPAPPTPAGRDELTFEKVEEMRRMVRDDRTILDSRRWNPPLYLNDAQTAQLREEHARRLAEGFQRRMDQQVLEALS
jgi:hypothetical protein